MSQYVLIAGAACVLVGFILDGVSVGITIAKSKQSSTTQDKTTLRVAGIFLGISMIFLLFTLVSAFFVLAAKQCRRTRIVFLIFALLAAICMTIAFVIIRIYVKKKADAGDTAGARDLSAAWIMPLVALPLFLVGLILLYSVAGRRLRSLNRVCKRAGNAKQKSGGFGGMGLPMPM